MKSAITSSTTSQLDAPRIKVQYGVSKSEAFNALVKCASCPTQVKLNKRSLARQLARGVSPCCSYACANIQRSKIRSEELEVEESSITPVPVTSLKIVKALQSCLKNLPDNPQQQTILEALPDKYKPYWYGIAGTPRVKLSQIKDLSLRKCTCGIYFADTTHSYCSHACYVKTQSKFRDRQLIEFKALKNSCTKNYVFTKRDTAKYKKYVASYPGSLTLEYLFVLYIVHECNDLDFARKYMSQPTNSLKGRTYLALGGQPASCASCSNPMLLRYTDTGKQIRHCSSKCAGVNPITKSVRAKTNLKKYGTEYVARLESSKTKSRATCISTYGVPNWRLSPEGMRRSRFFKRKPYVMGGMTYMIQGYENYALDYIQAKGVDPKLIKVSDLPVIKYRHKLRIHSYFPDIWIPSKNILVEVKSTYTILRNLNEFQKNCAKAKAALREGYDFRLMVFNDNGTRVRLPKDWFSLSFTQVRSIVYDASKI